MRPPLAPDVRGAVVLHSWTCSGEKWALKAMASAVDLDHAGAQSVTGLLSDHMGSNLFRHSNSFLS